MQEMNQSSEETAGIVRIMDEIAFQTDIMALNVALTGGVCASFPSPSCNGAEGGELLPQGRQAETRTAFDEALTRTKTLLQKLPAACLEQMPRHNASQAERGAQADEEWSSDSLLALADRLQNLSSTDFAPETAWPPRAENTSPPIGVLALMPRHTAFPREDEAAS